MSSEASLWSKRGLLLACAFVLAFFLLQLGEPELHAQSRANLKFLKSESLAAAIDEYPKIWLPAYPVMLYGAKELGIRPEYFNLLCFFALLALVSSFARRYLRNVSPLAPIALLVASGAIYANMQHVVAETFFALLAVATLMLVLACRERPTVLFTLALSATVALASLTKHFGFLWLAPLACVYVALVFARRSARAALAHASLFAATAAAMALPWFLHVKDETGRFFAAKRTTPRNLPPKLEHWNDQIDFATNVLFSARTLLIDLFSPFQLAEHEVVEARFYTVEVVIFAAVLCATAAAIACTAGASKRTKPWKAPEWLDLLLHPQVVPAVFAASYFAALIAVWSFANNDPIYTRFLYPAYPFVFLVALSAYSLAKERATTPWARAPFLVLFALYVVVNANRFAIV